VDVFAIIEKSLSLAKKKSINYQSDGRRREVDCVQQIFQQSFDHVDDLEARP